MFPLYFIAAPHFLKGDTGCHPVETKSAEYLTEQEQLQCTLSMRVLKRLGIQHGLGLESLHSIFWPSSKNLLQHG